VELVPENVAFIRLVISVAISITMLVLTLSLSPFTDIVDGTLAVTSHAMLAVIFVGAGYIKAYEDTASELESIGEKSFASKIYGFTSTEQVAGALITFAVSLFLLLMGILVFLLINAGLIQHIRLRTTGRPPQLILEEGQNFHLFLSHIWSTGQDAVATMKRQLQRLIPTVSVFLE
jgi:hypothetical protein